MPDGLFCGQIDEGSGYGCVVPGNDDGCLSTGSVGRMGDAAYAGGIARIGLGACVHAHDI